MATFQGTPCKRGHDGMRYTRNGDCVECAKARTVQSNWRAANLERANATAAAWRVVNRERRRAAAIAYRAANKERAKVTAAAWRKANPERVKGYVSAWRKANPQHLRVYAAAYHAANGERLKAADVARYWANPERHRAASTAWAKANPHKRCATQARRQAAKLQATPPWARTAEHQAAIAALYAKAADATATTGKPWHVDHLIPLKQPLVCGLHCIANLALMPGRENVSKSNKLLSLVEIEGLALLG